MMIEKRLKEVNAELERLEQEKCELLRKKQELEYPKICHVYLHSDEDEMYETGEISLGLDSKALSTFSYCCYEVDLTLEVHSDGTAFATHINKVPLTEKVEV